MRHGPACAPGRGWTPSPGSLGTPAPVSNARATSPRLDLASTASRRRLPMARTSDRMRQRSSGPALAIIAAKSAVASGSSSGCMYTVQPQARANGRAEQAWSGWQWVSRIGAGRESAPNRDRAALSSRRGSPHSCFQISSRADSGFPCYADTAAPCPVSSSAACRALISSADTDACAGSSANRGSGRCHVCRCAGRLRRTPHHRRWPERCCPRCAPRRG
jgi:hypothetical protein